MCFFFIEICMILVLYKSHEDYWIVIILQYDDLYGLQTAYLLFHLRRNFPSRLALVWTEGHQLCVCVYKYFFRFCYIDDRIVSACSSIYKFRTWNVYVFFLIYLYTIYIMRIFSSSPLYRINLLTHKKLKTYYIKKEDSTDLNIFKYVEWFMQGYSYSLLNMDKMYFFYYSTTYNIEFEKFLMHHCLRFVK